MALIIELSAVGVFCVFASFTTPTKAKPFGVVAWNSAPSTVRAHRAPVGQGPPGPDWLATALGFWSSGRVLTTGTAWWAGAPTLHRVRPLARDPRPPGPDWLAISLGF